MTRTPDQIMEQLLEADRLWLFLDYDGTLVDFAPTPEHAVPDPEVVAIVERLTRCRQVRVAVISGRRLSQVQQLMPIPNILLGGTYGVELQTRHGEIVYRAKFNTVRPILEELKSRWLPSIARRQGFFLEDKGWALALHARFAADADAEQVLSSARAAAVELATSPEFRLLHGERFIEVAPAIAHKGRTVAYVLERFPWSDALPCYLGDDNKDEEAFEIVKTCEGVAMLVAAEPRTTYADARLASPQQAQHWLNQLAELLSAKGN
jgi:trehalose-phosphatase